MKVGPAVVTLYDPENGNNFEERLVNGKNHFVAVLGKEFRIRVIVSNKDKTLPKTGHLRVGLSLDDEYVNGYIVGLRQLAIEDESVEFAGFNNSKGYTAFQFHGESFTFDALQEDPNSKIGLLTLTLASTKRSIRGESYSTDDDDESDKDGEEKDESVDPKFKVKMYKAVWNQPSACIGSGRLIRRKVGKSKRRYSYEQDGRYKKTYTVPYHTAQVLDRWEKSEKIGNVVTVADEEAHNTGADGITSSSGSSSSSSFNGVKIKQELIQKATATADTKNNVDFGVEVMDPTRKVVVIDLTAMNEV